jgi:hypothetical protein
MPPSGPSYLHPRPPLHPLAQLGDGRGHVGVIIAGDSTGAVFILRMTDVLRVGGLPGVRRVCVCLCLCVYPAHDRRSAGGWVARSEEGMCMLVFVCLSCA